MPSWAVSAVFVNGGAMIYGTIICLGDSLTNGARDELWRGYPVELELLMYQRHGQNWNCINAGINGETSIDVYKRAYGVLKSHPEAGEMVLLCGTNDSKVQVDTPPDRFAEHVEAILRCAQRWDKISYLCLIPDLKGFGAPDFCKQSLIDQYNERLQALATKWGNRLVDLRGMDASMYSDGVHLNNAGYKEVALRVAAVIEQNRSYGEAPCHPALLGP
jgi:lysophospholipase L1-like esterase